VQVTSEADGVFVEAQLGSGTADGTTLTPTMATATADDLLAQLGVEIYNSMASWSRLLSRRLASPSPPCLYRPPTRIVWPIRNYGTTCVVQTPRLIVREPLAAVVSLSVGAPARDRGLSSNFTPPPRAEFFGARASTLQAAEPSECHCMRIFPSSDHVPSEGKDSAGAKNA